LLIEGGIPAERAIVLLYLCPLGEKAMDEIGARSLSMVAVAVAVDGRGRVRFPSRNRISRPCS